MPELYEYKGILPQVDETAYVAPGAKIVGEVTIGKDSGIWFNAVVRGDMAPVSVGNQVNVQDNATLHTAENQPCIIGNNVTIGHNAVVHGCEIADDVLIGMHAIILNGVKVGKGSIVAAGALVTERTQIPEKVLVAGIPAKIIREVKPAEIEGIRENAQIYLNLAREYRGK